MEGNTKTVNMIMSCDCIKGMKELKDESVDMIIADPPYNIGKDFGNNSDKQKIFCLKFRFKNKSLNRYKYECCNQR